MSNTKQADKTVPERTAEEDSRKNGVASIELSAMHFLAGKQLE